MKQLSDHAVIVCIPDTQVRADAPWKHCEWIGKYVTSEFAGRPNFTLVHLGDHATMDSLSTYERPGSKALEGLRYAEDIRVANEAFDALCAPWERNNDRRAKAGKPTWDFDKHLLLGNHCDRITRAINADPTHLEGVISLDDLNYKQHGFQVHDFLEVIDVHGIAMSHYFQNTGNGRAISGQIETMIKSIGKSFVCGHRQGLRSGVLETPTGRKRGIQAGSCYIAPEKYRGEFLGAHEWRGIVVLFEVRDGDFCLCEVSLDYLCRRFEGVSLGEWYSDWLNAQAAA